MTQTSTTEINATVARTLAEHYVSVTHGGWTALADARGIGGMGRITDPRGVERCVSFRLDATWEDARLVGERLFVVGSACSRWPSGAPPQELIDALQAAIAAHPSADQMTRARAWALGREGAAAPPFKTQEAADAFALGRAARGSHP